MELIRGVLQSAQKVVLYGPEGIGKSTFAAQFPEPVFIDTEGSTKHMDVTRFPKPTSWAMLLAEVQEVVQNPAMCKTLVVDTADWAELLCTKHICDKFSKASIEEFGYGKGYTYLSEEMGGLLNKLEEVIQRGVNVVLTAHAKMRKFEQPDEMGAYDRWEMKLSKNVAPMVKEWADMVLFATYKTIVVKTEDKKAKAQGGKRVMHTTHHPCWDAKNRHDLADELPFTYAAIAAAIAGKAPAPTAPLEAAPITPEAPEETNITLVQTSIPQVAPSAALPEEASFTPPESDPLAEEIPDNLPRALIDLMTINKVKPSEIELIVSDRGYMPLDMPLRDYPPAFIEQVLIGAWEQVYKSILEDRKKIPF